MIEVESTDYDRTTQYVYNSKRNFISVTTKSPGTDAYSYTVEKATPAYLEHVVKMRNLVGYAGAPDTVLQAEGDKTWDWESIFIVKALDAVLEENKAFKPNCVLYDSIAAVETANSCKLSAGPVRTLGQWEGKAKAVWVRDGFNLALFSGWDLGKSAGYDVYSSSQQGANRPDAERYLDGHLFILKDQASLKAASLVCQPQTP